MTFIQFMQRYPHSDPDRIALADCLRDLSTQLPEAGTISSLSDFMIIADELTDPAAIRAATPDLWAEYLAIKGASS